MDTDAAVAFVLGIVFGCLVTAMALLNWAAIIERDRAQQHCAAACADAVASMRNNACWCGSATEQHVLYEVK